MKRSFYTLTICLAALFSASETTQAKPAAPCTIDTSNGCVAGTLGYGKVCPGSLADATAGVSYSASNSFELPDSFPLNTATFGLDFGVIIVSVDQVAATITGLPQGLTANFSEGGGIYYPNSSNYGGCVNISGIPCDLQGTYNVSLNFTAEVTVPFVGTITLPFPLTTAMTLNLNSTYPTLTITAPYSHLCLSGPGSAVTLDATTGFGTYAWSNSATTDTITVDTSTEYYVTVTTTDSVCTFSDSIQIGSVQAQVTSNAAICKGVFLALNATGGDTYTWTPGQYLDSANVADPIVGRALDTTTLFTVIVSNGICSDTGSVLVSVNDSCVSACGSCTPTPSGCTGDLPLLCSTIAPAQAGVEYSGTVTFYLPATVSVASLLNLPITIPGLPTTIALDNAQIIVDTLPAGFSWSTDQSGNNNMYYPSLNPAEQYGCLNICGKTCSAASANYMKVKAMVVLPPSLKAIVENLILQGYGSALGLDTIVTIPISGAAMTLYYADSLVINPPGSPVSVTSGDSINLQPNLSYASYSWSTGSTDSTINVDSASVYCVTVTDTSGCTQSLCKQVTIVSGIGSIKDLAASLNIYPNPNDGLFNLTFTTAQSQDITTQVFDVTGKVVYQKSFISSPGINNIAIDLGNAAKGIYVVKVAAGDGVVNRKITLE